MNEDNKSVEQTRPIDANKPLVANRNVKIVGKCPTCGRDHANTGEYDAQGRPVIRESVPETRKEPVHREEPVLH